MTRSTFHIIKRKIGEIYIDSSHFLFWLFLFKWKLDLTIIEQDFNQTSFTNDDKNNIIFGAVSQYLEELLDKKDGEKIW